MAHPHQHTLLFVAALFGAAAAACSGVIGDGEAPRRRGTTGTDDPNAAITPLAPVAFPLARLTRSQYENTIRDLFAPIVIQGEIPLPPADVVIGTEFEGNTATQTPSPALVEAYHAAAVFVSSAVMTDSAAALGCTPTSRAEEDACAARFIDTFGRKAFRRPMAAEDTAKLVALYNEARTGGSDLPGAMTTVIQAVLQSTSFLYRVELGTPTPGNANVMALGSWEMASRLSYLLWNTMPDQTLFAAAEANDLVSPEALERHARRMLAEPRAKSAVANFHRQWLKLDKIENVRKDTGAYAGFTAATASAMRAATAKRVESVFFGDGSLRSLLTGTQAWVNDELAPYYGVAAPGGAELKLVDLDPTQRGGILTDVGLLSLLAHEAADSPIMRGVYVLDRIACSPTPPPPKNVPPTPASNPANPKTVRERLELVHEQGSCATCHKSIDGIGFAFGHYDAVGKWRTTESGLPIDDSGHFENAGDLQGTFVGAMELGRRLAESKTVQTCVASNWMRYALGVDGRGIDTTKLTLAVDAFTEKGLDMRELVVALVKSDVFRTRLVEP